MIQQKTTATLLLALLLVVGSSHNKSGLQVEAARRRTITTQRGRAHRTRTLHQQAPHNKNYHHQQPLREEIPDYRHTDRQHQQRSRDLFITGRKNAKDSQAASGSGPPKMGLMPPGMGEVGPDGMPDLVVYHYAESPIHQKSNSNDEETADVVASLEASTEAFPGLSDFDRNQQGVGRTRMRGGNVLSGSNASGSLGLGFGQGTRGSGYGYGSGGGKSNKSNKSNKSGKSDPGCFRKAQNALRRRKGGKSNKADGKGYAGLGAQQGDDDDDGAAAGGFLCGDEADNNGGNGSGGDGSGGDGSGGDGYGGDGSGVDGSGSGGDGSGGDGSGGDGTGGDQGLCKDYDVAFTVPDPGTGESKIIFLQGKDGEPGAQGVGALVQSFDFPVKISDSTGFALTLGFLVDTSKAKKVSDMDGSGTFTEEDVAMTLDAAVSTPVALEVGGCTDAAMAKANEYHDAHKVSKDDYRRLEKADTNLVVMRDWVCQNGSCARDGGANCELECRTSLYYYGDLSSPEVRVRIDAALLKYMMLMDDVTHWYPIQTPTIGIEEIDTSPAGDNAAGVQEEITRESAERTKAGPYIGAAAGALALLLLLILFVRRNRRNQDDDEVSHLKLEDDDGDGTFIQELASEGTPEREYRSGRDIHVIGETDSIFSDWTGYTGKRPTKDGNGMNNGRLGHVHTDVHHCSSATCEVCELRRQQGVNFVATGSPVRPRSLPKDASREYAADDTVSL